MIQWGVTMRIELGNGWILGTKEVRLDVEYRRQCWRRWRRRGGGDGERWHKAWALFRGRRRWQSTPPRIHRPRLREQGRAWYPRAITSPCYSQVTIGEVAVAHYMYFFFLCINNNIKYLLILIYFIIVLFIRLEYVFVPLKLGFFGLGLSNFFFWKHP